MFKFYLVLALKTLVCDLTWKSFRVTLAGTFPSFLGGILCFLGGVPSFFVGVPVLGLFPDSFMFRDVTVLLRISQANKNQSRPISK